MYILEVFDGGTKIGALRITGPDKHTFTDAVFSKDQFIKVIASDPDGIIDSIKDTLCVFRVYLSSSFVVTCVGRRIIPDYDAGEKHCFLVGSIAINQDDFRIQRR